MNRLLWELQEADTHIAALKRERGKLDDGAHARGERDTLRAAHDQERTHLSALNTERTDRELQLKTMEEKLARQQSRLMTASSAHEVTALERDIKGLTARRGELDEAVLTLMDDIEACSHRLTKLESALQQKTAETEAIESHFAAETARLEAAMSAARTQRDDIAARLSEADEESLQKYAASAARFHGVAVAHPDRGNCSACGMALTPFNLREAKTQQWPTCESCGRLLFVE